MKRSMVIAGAILAVAIACAGENRVTNDEYRMSASFPTEFTLCVARSGDHPHGFFMRLEQKDCDDQKPGPAISVYADSNVLFESNPDDILADECEDHRLLQSSRSKLQLEFSGRLSSACRIDHPDGSIDIDVVTQAGEWPGSHDSSDLSAPYINYRASLSTTSDRLEQDLKIFRAVLHSVRIEYPK